MARKSETCMEGKIYSRLKKSVIIYGITFPYMQVFHIQLILQKNNTENADTMIDIYYKS